MGKNTAKYIYDREHDFDVVYESSKVKNNSMHAYVWLDIKEPHVTFTYITDDQILSGLTIPYSKALIDNDGVIHISHNNSSWFRNKDNEKSNAFIDAYKDWTVDNILIGDSNEN